MFVKSARLEQQEAEVVYSSSKQTVDKGSCLGLLTSFIDVSLLLENVRVQFITDCHLGLVP